MQAMKEKAQELFAKRDFAQLEELAERSRQDPKVFASGTCAIVVFYRAFHERPNTTSDHEWQKEIEGLQDWIAAKPESVTARVALASVWVVYAWAARGNGYGEKHPELMMERLEKAHSVLDEARRLGPKCPGWYFQAENVALGEGWGRKEVDEVFEEGRKLYPDVLEISLARSYYLQQRWYGNPGEWEAFVTKSADQVGGEEGDILYARLLWYLDSKSDNVFGDGDIPWERVKRSFRVLLKRYPESLNALGAFARLACHAQDWATARQTFEQIGDRVELKTWKNKAEFLAFRNEAYRKR